MKTILIRVFPRKSASQFSRGNGNDTSTDAHFDNPGRGGGGCGRSGTSVDPQVAARVWDLTSDEAVVVQAAVDFLVAQDAKLVVPALMERIDDLHELKVQRVILQDVRRGARPQRILHPKKYCDLVASLLQQKTGQSFGNLADGASDAQRLKTIAAWQQWWKQNQAKY